jgi:CO/xanthine dehydrogenase Mo-binding subunit
MFNGTHVGRPRPRVWDHALGREMNHNLAEYHLPVNADVPPLRSSSWTSATSSPAPSA